MNQYTGTPKYAIIVETVKDNLKNRVWKAGDKLPTEKELAEQFSVSRQTVRRALEELTKDGVISSVQGSGSYIQSTASLSRGLRVSHKNIAVISTFVDNYIFPATLRGIQTVLTEAEYTMQLAFTDDSISKERTILTNLLEQDNVDGIIVEPAKSALPNPNLYLYRELMTQGIPIIFFNAYHRDIPLPCMRMDDFDTARRATELLIERGHTNIAGIFHPEDGQGHLRYAGFLKALWDHDLQACSQNVVWRAKTIDFAMLNKGVTGVVCYNDEVAYKLIVDAQKHGLTISDDLSVVGIDDSDLSSLCSVPITSFVHPKEILGRDVAKNMLTLIQDPDFDANRIYYAELVERSSVAFHK